MGSTKEMTKNLDQLVSKLVLQYDEKFSKLEGLESLSYKEVEELFDIVNDTILKEILYYMLTTKLKRPKHIFDFILARRDDGDFKIKIEVNRNPLDITVISITRN